MWKDTPCKGDKKRVRMTTLMSHKIYFETKIVTRGKEVHYMIRVIQSTKYNTKHKCT